MIVSRKCRFVYVAPPRTGSTSLHTWLSQPALCDVPWDREANQHDCDVPADAREYFTFASVRHPVARALSLWRYFLCDPAAPKLRFDQFVTDLASLHPFYSRRQVDWLRGVRLDAVLRAEQLTRVYTLPPIFRRLTLCTQALPYLNRSPQPQDPPELTPAIRAALAEYFADDFDAFYADDI